MKTLVTIDLEDLLKLVNKEVDFTIYAIKNLVDIVTIQRTCNYCKGKINLALNIIESDNSIILSNHSIQPVVESLRILQSNLQSTECKRIAKLLVNRKKLADRRD